MNLSRRSFLFGVGATAVALTASSSLFPAPTFRHITVADIRVGDTFTIEGVMDPATGRLKTFTVIDKSTDQARITARAAPRPFFADFGTVRQPMH